MFDVCGGGLSAALERPPLELALRSIFALLSILGWGFLGSFRAPAVEVWDFAYAYVQGLVVVSILLLLGSVTVGAEAFVPIGGVGFVALLVRIPRLFKRTGLKPERAFIPAFSIVFLAAIPFLIQLLRPFPFSDSTSIWAFHAKALSCEPLFQSHYVRERFWAGTHPEYPLFFPLIEAFFFRATNSFRDDWSKLWELFAALSLLVIALRETFAVSKNVALSVLATGALLCLMSNEGWDGKVELSVFIFTALCALAFLKEDWCKMPLFLFGLAFTKNEGLVSACVAGALFLPWMMRTRQGRRSWGASFVLVLFWILISSRLPSLHEQYLSALANAGRWKAGIDNAGPIFFGMLDHFKHWHWLSVFVLAPVAILGFGRGPKLRVLCLWPATMIGVFFVIYLVSPWGPSLHALTFDRLLFPLSAPILLALFLACGGRSWARWLGYAIFAFLCMRVKLTTEGLDALSDRNYLSNSDWQIALRLDRELPIGASGALLNDPMYYTLNFMLYPRRFYAASPEVIAGTRKPWKEWRKPSDVPKDPRYEFIVDALGADASGARQKDALVELRR